MNHIYLNFLELECQDFTFLIYRKEVDKFEDVPAGEKGYSLYPDKDAEDKANYFVSLEPKEGYDEFQCNPKYNVNLTKWVFFEALKTHFAGASGAKPVSRHKVLEIQFVIGTFEAGEQIISLSPYYLQTENKFGVLINFKFNVNNAYPFNKEVQRLSLSLDTRYKSNKNFYLDKLQIINKFLKTRLAETGKFELGDSLNILRLKLIKLPAYSLDKKEYIFSNGRKANSQFMGVRNFGPYESLSDDVQFIFIFEDRFKTFANDIFLSLTGKQHPGTFQGMEKMFHVKLTKDNVDRLAIKSYNETDLLEVVEHVVEKSNSSFKKTIAIFIEDYSEEEGNSAPYYFLKYHFMLNDIPLQVLNYKKLGGKNMLKWSASNIGLQVFSKLGGKPWIVEPAHKDCLILGIGAAHKYDKATRSIKKYFAYTVCLDSSGLYKKLDILADNDNETDYLENLENNIVELLKQDEFKHYTSCVLHLPFKIKGKEIQALKRAIQRVSELKFIVVKINTKNNFFGFSSHNTHVPYESTYIKLANNKFLVWFEGLNYGKEVVDKRISNPVDIEFLNFGDLNNREYKAYLQDIINLSGANWRGFNAKSAPISIFYSKIIANYLSEFSHLENSKELLKSNNKPWFL